MTMQKPRPAGMLLAFIATAALAFGDDAAASEKPKPLTRELAQHLIAEFFEMGKTEIRIAFILDGKIKKEGFETDVGAEVTFIRPVVEESRRRRAVHSIQFQHDRALGWFLKAVVRENGRTFIDICSETQGRIRIE